MPGLIVAISLLAAILLSFIITYKKRTNRNLVKDLFDDIRGKKVHWAADEKTFGGNSMNDVIVQFAVLWGQFIGSAVLSSTEMRLAEEMKQYDSEELLEIFTAWADEFHTSSEEDTVEFFNEMLADLLHE